MIDFDQGEFKNGLGNIGHTVLKSTNFYQMIHKIIFLLLEYIKDAH